MRSRIMAAAVGVGLVMIAEWGLGRWYPALRYRFQAPCRVQPCVDAGVVALVGVSAAVALFGVALICLAVAAVLQRPTKADS